MEGGAYDTLSDTADREVLGTVRGLDGLKRVPPFSDILSTKYMNKRAK